LLTKGLAKNWGTRINADFSPLISGSPLRRSLIAVNQRMKIRVNPREPIPVPMSNAITDITMPELPAILANSEAVLVDVRDEWEFDEFNIGGLNIPLPDIRARKVELLPFDTIIVMCTNGARSRVAARDFARQPEFQDKQIYHVNGGIIEAE